MTDSGSFRAAALWIARRARRRRGARARRRHARPRRHRAAALRRRSLHVTCVADPERALALVERQFFSVVLDRHRHAGAGAPASRRSRAIKRALADVDGDRADAAPLVRRRGRRGARRRDRSRSSSRPTRSRTSRIACSRPPAARSASARSTRVLDDIRTVHEEFLQRFMEAERRAIDLADKVAGRDPSRARQHRRARACSSSTRSTTSSSR